jgi:hypothetical protein
MSFGVLVIHGVANRSRPAFEETVERLATSIGLPYGDQIVPVFWGELGPDPGQAFTSIPTDVDSIDLPGAEAAFAPIDLASQAREIVQEISPIVDPTIRAQAVADQTIQGLDQRLVGGVPEDVRNAIRRGVDDAAHTGRWLALQVDLSKALIEVAEAALVSEPGEAAFLPVDVLDRLRDRIESVLETFDREAGRLVGGVLERVLREQQAKLGPFIATTLGDVLTYAKNGAAIRGVLDEAYQQLSRRFSEVDVVAHSLGGIVTTEWMLGAPTEREHDHQPTPVSDRRVRRFVTFGTQVGLLSEIHGLLGNHLVLEGVPNVLPIRLRRWRNIWHQLDPLAFVMRRALAIAPGDDQDLIRDFRLQLLGLPTSLDALLTHGSYWTDDRFLNWLKLELLSEE